MLVPLPRTQHSSCKEPPESVMGNLVGRDEAGKVPNKALAATLSLDFLLRTMGSTVGFRQDMLRFAV